MPTLPDSLRLPELRTRTRRLLSVALVVVTAAGVALTAIAYSFTANSPPIDFGTFGPPGARLLTGDWGAVFGDPIIQAGPFELAFWGIPQLLGVSGAAQWAGFTIVACSLAAVLIALVVERALRGVASGWSVPLAVLAAAIAALSGTLVSAVANGHPAQVAVPVLWMTGAFLARSGRPFAAAAAIALTAGWELWGLLGIPVLLLAPRIDLRTLWRSAVGGIAVVALLFLPFVLLGPFRMFGFAWPVYDGTLAHLIDPGADTFPWALRLAQGALSVGAGVAVVFATRRSWDAIWLAPLAVCSVRLLLDPVLAGYYTVAPVILVVVGTVFALAQRSVLVLVGCVVVLNVLIDFARLTAPTAVILVAAVAGLTVLVVRASDRTAGAALAKP